MLSALAALASRLQRYVADNERLLVVAASTLIMSASHTALRPVLPVFAKGFGVGAAAVGTTISAYALARLLLNVPAGLLGDRHGRKPLLVWGPLVTALGMVGCGLAASFGELLAWRFVTGAGSAAQMAGAQLFLADISNADNRARSLGANQAASLAGGMLGPAVGGALADAAGLRAAFTLTGLAALAAAMYGFLRLPETLKRRRAAVGQAAGQPSGEAASAGVGSGSKTLAAQGPRPEPGTKRKATLALLADSNFRAVALLNAVLFMTANGSRSVLLPLLAVQSFKLKPTSIGLIFAGMAVVSLLMVLPAAAVADRLGRKWAIVPSTLAMAAALALCAMSAAGSSLQLFGVAVLVYAVGNACVGASPTAYAADVMPPGSSGLGLGIYRSAGDIGLMLGPAVLGLIADATSVQTALVANSVIVAVTIAYFAFEAREVRRPAVA